jgi:hypothetical protein
LSNKSRLARIRALIEASGVGELLDAKMPTGGRPRSLGAATVLTGIMLALSDHRPAHLAAAHRALLALGLKDRLALGVSLWHNGVLHDVSYRQFADTHQVMLRSIDPSPVPSFKGVPHAERAARLASARAEVDAGRARRALCQVVDALLEESIPDAYKRASSSVAVDWTDHETWSRPRPRDDTVPAADPDASWGHAKRNAPGAKDSLFYGYYAQVVTMVADDGAGKVPELVRRIALAAPKIDPARLMAETLVRLSATVRLGDVICDCGYSNREPASFATPLRRAGAQLVMDLHPGDRGPKGNFEGAILANGQLYCPLTPRVLLELGPLSRAATPEETRRHDTATAELARYKLSVLAGPDAEGYVRLRCPASAGRLRCPRKPASLQLPGNRPSVVARAEEFLPRCCLQDTITVPPQVNAKTRQRHDFASRAHRLSYARRTAAERTYASLSDPSVGGIRRGWCRLFGLGKNTLMYVLAVVVRNLRIVEAFEARRAEEARRAAGGSHGRRRRRYETGEPTRDLDRRPEPLLHPD